MNFISLDCKLRENQNPKSLRKMGRCPAVVYGEKGSKGVSVDINAQTFSKMVHSDPCFMTKVYKLLSEDNGKEWLCIIKEALFHPVTEEIWHVDFMPVKDGQKVIMNFPIKIINQHLSSGYKRGGLLRLVKFTTKVICTIGSEGYLCEADVNGMGVGQKVYARDLKMPNGCEPLDPNATIGQMKGKRVAKAEEDSPKTTEEASTASPSAAGKSDAAAPSKSSK